MATYPVTAGNLQLLAGGIGNFTSDIIDRGPLARPGLLQIDATAGTTVTANIQGSADGTNWFNVPYATTAAPQTPVVAAVTLTTTAVSQYHLLAFAWRFLRVVFTANTGMTINSIAVLA